YTGGSRRIHLQKNHNPRASNAQRAPNVRHPYNRADGRMITMVTRTKLFADIPFAHRQHGHDGHCDCLHGHNCSIPVTFEADGPDINGFVVDVGKLKYLERWIDEVLDHACLINKDDEEGKRLVLSNPDLFKFAILDDVSCEGLAKFVYEEFNT